MTEPVLRLFQFRPTESGSVLDSLLRESVAPRLLATPGLSTVWVGRHGDEREDRIVVSVWATAAAMEAAGDDRSADQLEFASPAGLADVRIETHPIRFHYEQEGAPVASILRLFRGRTRTGELEAYAEEARAGLEEDLRDGHGPVALCLALDPPDRFVTASVWATWSDVEASTGGDVRNPMATRHGARLREAVAIHYELVPNVISPASSPTTS